MNFWAAHLGKFCIKSGEGFGIHFKIDIIWDWSWKTLKLQSTPQKKCPIAFAIPRKNIYNSWYNNNGGIGKIQRS